MKKLMMAVLAGFLSITVAGAYAGESKGDDKKSDTGTVYLLRLPMEMDGRVTSPNKSRGIRGSFACRASGRNA